MPHDFAQRFRTDASFRGSPQSQWQELSDISLYRSDSCPIAKS